MTILVHRGRNLGSLGSQDPENDHLREQKSRGGLKKMALSTSIKLHEGREAVYSL